MREYDLLDEALSKKYTHPATQWYQKRHLFIMDGGIEEEFKVLKPAKNIEEALQQTKIKS